MSNHILEVCVDSVESAIAAVRGGANRLELCSNLVIGGTTPGASLFKQVKKLCPVPVHVLLRPRYGDFLYTGHEFELIREDAAMFIRLGADGIVSGCLTPKGDLDVERMAILRETAGKRHLTLHRAFDMCRDPFRAMEDAIATGINTILTSGQKNTCMEGRNLLRQLIKQADGRIAILAGSGVNARNILSLAKETGANHFHLSGKVTLDSGMVYRKNGVHMGIDGMDEYTLFRTDEEQIRQAARQLELR